MEHCIRCGRTLKQARFTANNSGPYGSVCVKKADSAERHNLFSGIEIVKPEPTLKERIQDLVKGLASDCLFSVFTGDEQIAKEADIIHATDSLAENLTAEIMNLIDIN